MNGQNREHINVYCSWKNRIQQYAFNWYPNDVCIGDNSEHEEDPDYNGGANKMSLIQARVAFKNGEKVL